MLVHLSHVHSLTQNILVMLLITGYVDVSKVSLSGNVQLYPGLRNTGAMHLHTRPIRLHVRSLLKHRPSPLVITFLRIVSKQR